MGQSSRILRDALGWLLCPSARWQLLGTGTWLGTGDSGMCTPGGEMKRSHPGDAHGRPAAPVGLQTMGEKGERGEK